MFGKAMKLPDELVTLYLRHYTLVPLAEIAVMDAAIASGELNPMQAKQVLGRALVERYFSAEAAVQEQEWFGRVFSGRSVPADVPEAAVPDPNATLLEILRYCLPAESGSALRRLIADGGVRLDGVRKLTDPDQRHPLSSGDVIRIGKRRWFRIVYR
jgi:tyrosyl-tRNA synthetase